MLPLVVGVCQYDMKEIKEEYLKLTPKELEDLEYTGDWELDKKRFSSAWKKNQDVFDLSGWDNIEEEYDEEERYI